MIDLGNDDFELQVSALTGGSITQARWRGTDILRPATGCGVLNASSFPLAPFSNRIANSRFSWRGQTVELEPNHPDDHTSPAIHGFAWLQAWEVLEHSADRLELAINHEADRRWPWKIHLRQTFQLRREECEISLILQNLDTRDMPAGLGFHPYFPSTPRTKYYGLHQGEWQVDRSCIPTRLIDGGEACDWWKGKPVNTRNVDTVYVGRQGSLRIDWPEREMGLEIIPSEDLTYTTVYVPSGEDYFCVEPVSHMTDAFNRPEQETGMRVLSPGEEWTVSMSLRPYGLQNEGGLGN